MARKDTPPLRAKKPRHALPLPPAVHTMASDEALPIIARAAEGRVLVSFSGGKDSVGCVLQLRRYFEHVHLFHMYTVPGLRIVEEALTYYEALWQTRITRVAHPILMDHLEKKLWQPWHRYPLIDRWGPEVPTYADVFREVRRDLGWDKRVPMAVGIRMDDSIFRQSSLKRTGCYNANRNTLYPIFDWSRAKLREELIATGTRLAPDYRICGRSFSGNGLDFRYIEPVRRHYPDDWVRLLQWFPALEAEYWRYEFARRHRSRALRESTTFSL